ncbi:MAG: phosphate/phosphite/phosphonate ABC transporter substrate-binding protein [Sterolibacteriaceae bacterium MAG5]|nr:phosphate/phosphite/phosphonate ABC transporter substrate-binding protein [Candidatus Nitricoxidireducens bremensis]
MWKIATGAFWRVLSVLLFAGVGLPAWAGNGDAYTLAVLPGAPPITMHKLWSPIVERLAKESGLEFRLKLYEKMADFERDIWAGNPDFIYSSPIQIVVAHQSSGYLPLVRSAKPVRVGLFVRKDSPIRSVDELVGRKISFVGNKNLCSVAMQHLLTTGKLSFETEYSGSTRNVLINILLGKSDAGSIFLPEMDMQSDDTRNQLREIVTTPDIAPHPLSAHPRVAAKVRDRVKRAMIAIAATASGAELLKLFNLSDPVAADYSRDYRPLEVMDIKGMTHWGQ